MLQRSYFQIFFAVQKALFLRELTRRFTQSYIGLFWTFFEPFYQVAFLVILKVIIFGRESDNFDYIIFVSIAMTAFVMFKNILTSALGAFASNKNLFVYRQVKPIDTIFSRIMIELFLTSIVILIFSILAYYFNFNTNIENLVLVTFAYIWLLVFASALGIFFAILGTYTKVIAHIVGLFMRGLILLSAIFYPLNIISPELREILLYNPLVHFMEMIHGAYFYTLNDHYVDYIYMMYWTLLPLTFGLWFYIRLENRIASL